MFSLNSYGSFRNGMTPDTGSCGVMTFPDNNFVVRPADVVFVSAMQCNRVLLEKTFSGFSSLRDLLTVVGRCLGNATGLVTLHLRNRDRGCSTRRAVRYRRSEALFATA